MKKLTLDLDAIEVESFTTGSAYGRPGTVRGRDSTTDCTQTESGYDYCAENTQFCPGNTDKFTCAQGCRKTVPPQDTCDTNAVTCMCTADTCPETGCGMTVCGLTCPPCYG